MCATTNGTGEPTSIAVIGPERDSELISAAPPVGPFGEDAVGDVTQRAVRPAESRPDPVARLAEQGAVRVVNTDEFMDRVGHGWRLARTGADHR